MFYVPKYNLLEKLTLDQSNYKVYNIQDKNKPKKRKIEEPKDHLKKFHKKGIFKKISPKCKQTIFTNVLQPKDLANKVFYK